jgi:hypothetical protein
VGEFFNANDKAAIDRLRAQLNDQQREIAGERARNEVLRDDIDRLQAERADKDARIERQYAILLEHKSRAERAEAQLASAQNFIDMKGLRKEWAEFLCVSIGRAALAKTSVPDPAPAPDDLV